ncbi:MAG: SRPBCC domain-containing protein [Gemmatimonadaceae bacterium]
MPEILHDFPINATPEEVFAAVSTPTGLDSWWTLRSTGAAAEGQCFQLDFGPDYVWRARVTECRPAEAFELEMVEAMPDWTGSTVRFDLSEAVGGGTQLRFAHRGWDETSEHFRISSFCWAMYLRIMRRKLEHGEEVPYEQRLEV